SMRSNTPWPALISEKASWGERSVVNSLMSAPAMKPLFLAEQNTMARGGLSSSSLSRTDSSRSTSPDNTFVEAPALSKVMKATPSASVSSFQCEYADIGGLPLDVVAADDLEVADQRPVVR